MNNFHSSPIEIVNVKSEKKQKIGYKPRGFWYSCQDAWLKWTRSEQPNWEEKFYYKVEIDYSKILKISSYFELASFTEEYGKPDKFSREEGLANNTNYAIDWAAVASNYFGIEICPFIKDAKFEYTWYSSWDVASGVVWNNKAIKSVKLVKKPKKGKETLGEEVIGTSGGIRYYQMGGSLPDEFYNRTSDGKPTRDPGIPGVKKTPRAKNKMMKSSEDKPGKKEKRWYEINKENIRYKSLKVLFEEVNNENILVEYENPSAAENSDAPHGTDGEFPILSQIFYHGTNKEFASGDYIQPPSITDNISEKGRKKNLDKIFFTMDKGSAKIYAGRAVQSFGEGTPHIYSIQPLGEIEWVNKTPGTTVLMAPQAKVINKIE